MAFSRAAALRSCVRSIRPTIARPQLFRQVARRGYASGGHGSAKSGGDAIWAAGAVGVTVPTCWYLLSNAPDTSHGHDDHGDSHGESHGEEHEEEPKEESKEEGEKSEDAEEKGEESEKSEDSDSEDGTKDADTPDTSDDEGEDDSSDAKNTKKTSPDAKGGIKKKLESNKGAKAGETGAETSTSKPAGSQNTQSGKQEGLSNTDTKHSTDITNDKSKSKKGEGVPESAKAKGTVDPKRPQV